MKKTLLALAVLGAAAGTAAAANVQLYGVLDYGLKYTNTKADTGASSVDKFEMATGNQSGPRFGLLGSEELGNGLKVGFVLENGFSADDGKLGNNGRLFGRTAEIYLEGDFGKLIAGREGQLTSFNGTVGLIGGLSPFGASWGGSPEVSTFFVGNSRIDNSLTYVTPSLGGLKLYAQYSFDMNTKEDSTMTLAEAERTSTTTDGVTTWAHDTNDYKQTEGKTTANRYAAIGASYNAGNLNLALVAYWYNWSSNYAGSQLNGRQDLDDGFSVTAGGNYNFGVAKAYIGAQYFDNMIKTTTADDDTKDTFVKVGTGISGQVKGYGLIIGADAPVLGGTAMIAAGYTSTEEANPAADVQKTESDRWGVGVGYTYNLSKRTNLYGVAAYYRDSIKNERVEKTNTAGNLTGETSLRDRDPSATTVVVGIRHKF